MTNSPTNQPTILPSSEHALLRDIQQPASGRWIAIADGLCGYYARPDGDGPFPAVMLYIEAFGLNKHIKRVADRFAAAGFATVVPDIYHGAVYEYGDLVNPLAHMRSMDDDRVIAQSEKTLGFLARRSEIDLAALGVVGFSMGGRFAFLASAELRSHVAAAVAFYGGGIGALSDPFGRKPLLDRAIDVKAPLLLWYGADDPMIGADEHGRVATALSRARTQYTLTVFPGVTHGFFCDQRVSFDPVAAGHAWRGTVAFLRDYLVEGARPSPVA
jgi:carboxymethylenebutenolidase